MDYSLLSKYRGQLMGLAIIFVALFHSSLDHSYLIVDMLCFGGDMGVDIFFLISGFGMYYAFLKKPKLLQFYMKRVSRIVPAWFIVNLIIRFQEDDLTSIDKLFLLKTMTGFSFWIDGNLYFWYVSAILAFYLITPLFMFLYQKKKHYAYLTFSIIWFLLLGMSFVAHNASYFIFLFRWPVFFLGIYLGECSFNKKVIERKHIWISISALIVGLCAVDYVRRFNYLDLVRYDYKYFLYLFVTVPVCIFACMLFDKTTYDFPILKFLGKITLEIYLLHEFLLRNISGQLGDIPFDKIGIIYNIVVFCGVVMIAYVLHMIVEFVLRLVEKSEKK